MAVGAPPNPVIDTRPFPLAGQNSQGFTLHDKGEHHLGRTNSTSSIIPVHSSLPSPLSPPLSVSPPSFGSTMAELVASHHSPNAFSNASLPPLPPSAEHSIANSSSTKTSSSTHNQHSTRSGLGATSAYLQTSPEEWLAHAAQQRRHLSTGSFSSTSSVSSMARLSPDRSLTHSPSRLEFGESERVQSEDGMDQDNEREPEINVNMRPSELRASLMARAKRSSAKMQRQQQQQRRSESMPLERGSRLSEQRQVYEIYRHRHS